MLLPTDPNSTLLFMGWLLVSCLLFTILPARMIKLAYARAGQNISGFYPVSHTTLCSLAWLGLVATAIILLGQNSFLSNGLWHRFYELLSFIVIASTAYIKVLFGISALLLCYAAFKALKPFTSSKKRIPVIREVAASGFLKKTEDLLDLVSSSASGLPANTAALKEDQPAPAARTVHGYTPDWAEEPAFPAFASQPLRPNPPQEGFAPVSRHTFSAAGNTASVRNQETFCKRSFSSSSITVEDLQPENEFSTVSATVASVFAKETGHLTGHLNNGSFTMELEPVKTFTYSTDTIQGYFPDADLPGSNSGLSGVLFDTQPGQRRDPAQEKKSGIGHNTSFEPVGTRPAANTAKNKAAVVFTSNRVFSNGTSAGENVRIYPVPVHMPSGFSESETENIWHLACNTDYLLDIDDEGVLELSFTTKKPSRRYV